MGKKLDKWNHQSIDVDEDILNRIYKGDKRIYLFHEDPEYRRFILKQNKDRREQRMKEDPTYITRVKINQKKRNQAATLTEKAKIKISKQNHEKHMNNPEYLRLKIELYKEGLGIPTVRANETRYDKWADRHAKKTMAKPLPLELEIRELDEY